MPTTRRQPHPTQRPTRLRRTASSQDYQYAPDSNRLTSIGAQAVTSDAAGNLTQDRAARKLAYDAQGRLQSAASTASRSPNTATTPSASASSSSPPESVTTYLYGPDGQLLGEAEHDGSGRKLRAQYYLWLDSLPLATIDADYDAQGKVGNPTLLYLPWRPPRHPAPGHRRQRPDRLAVAVRRLRPRRSAEPGQHPDQPALPRAVLRCGERAALQLLPRL